MRSHWRERALCSGIGWEPFFPTGTPKQIHAQRRQAKAICHRCPVHTDCLVYALEHGIDHGMWGGLTPDERAQLLRSAAG